MTWVLGALALLFVLVMCLRVPPWAEEDWDYEAEARMRGWDKPNGD
jgi:hypothetical protein